MGFTAEETPHPSVVSPLSSCVHRVVASCDTDPFRSAAAGVPPSSWSCWPRPAGRYLGADLLRSRASCGRHHVGGFKVYALRCLASTEHFTAIAVSFGASLRGRLFCVVGVVICAAMCNHVHMEDEMVRINVWVSRELDGKMRDLSEMNDRPIVREVRRALEEYVERAAATGAFGGMETTEREAA